MLQENDTIGQIEWYGADGIDTNQRAALISAAVDGTPGANDMPGRLVFSTTADGASAPTERMRIGSNGNIIFNFNGSTATGTSLFADGTAASPGLSFWADGSSDTGIFRPGANILGFTTGGTERARLDSSGRLLVGTSTSPTDSINILAKGPVGGGGGGGCVGIGYAGSSGPGNGNTLGVLRFTANGNSTHAEIRARQDGATWTDGSDQPSRLEFSTTADGTSSPTTRMRIANSGETAVFAQTTVFNARSAAAASAGSNRLFQGWYGASNLVVGGTISFVVYTNGNVQNTNNSYGAISDIKLKENIVDANSQWDDLKALQVRNYNFKEGQTHTQIGLVAQEAELVSPGLVTESPDRDDEGNDLGTVTKSVNYSVLYMKAVKALQEAMERIETLEAKVAALETP